LQIKKNKKQNKTKKNGEEKQPPIWRKISGTKEIMTQESVSQQQ